jgi:hypothetical protein
MPADLLRRFTPTPLKAAFALDGVNVVVSTNQQFLVHRLQDAWGSAASERVRGSVFDWRVVVEANDHLQLESASIYHLRHDGLALITFGQNGFLACDLRTREGIGFIPQCLVNNGDLFQRNVLPALIALIKAAVDNPSTSRC